MRIVAAFLHLSTLTLWFPVVLATGGTLLLGLFGVANIRYKKRTIYGHVLHAVFGIGLVTLIFALAERIVWISEIEYPHMLHDVHLSKIDTRSFNEIVASCHRTMSVKHISKDLVALRCGYWWPLKRVWVLHSDLYQNAFTDQ